MFDFIVAAAYRYIYLILVAILTFSMYPKFSTRNGLQNYSSSRQDGWAVVLIIILTLFIGFRPVSGTEFVDMKGYVINYEAFMEGEAFHFSWDVENKIWDNLFAFWGSMRLGYTSWFVVMAGIYFSTSYLGIRRLFPDHRLVVYLIFLGAFSTFGYATNGVKAGVASSLFIWALSYRDNLNVCVPLVLLSWGFHHSMMLPVAALLLTVFYKNPKWYFYGWFFCLLLAFAHVSYFQNLFAGISDEKGAEYLTGDGETIKTSVMGGFRIDFILYSAMPVLVGYYAEMKKRLEISSMYRTLLHLYLCINGVWMLCMYAEFTNRIAYLSWFLYPIVLIYPLLNEDWGENRYRVFSKVMLAHICFTLFMEFIYYGSSNG